MDKTEHKWQSAEFSETARKRDFLRSVSAVRAKWKEPLPSRCRHLAGMGLEDHAGLPLQCTTGSP